MCSKCIKRKFTCVRVRKTEDKITKEYFASSLISASYSTKKRIIKDEGF